MEDTTTTAAMMAMYEATAAGQITGKGAARQFADGYVYGEDAGRYEQRVRRQRDALLAELEGYSLDAAGDDHTSEGCRITTLEVASEVSAVAAALETLDRIVYRVERARHNARREEA